jgi:hypothetical protein
VQGPVARRVGAGVGRGPRRRGSVGLGGVAACRGGAEWACGGAGTRRGRAAARARGGAAVRARGVGRAAARL